MSIFSWFLGGASSAKQISSGLATPQAVGAAARLEGSAAPSKATDLSPAARLAERRNKRHARREQLYVAIRECMTRAGVLSASYKFKVLSLDQRGDQFMVMMDVAPSLSSQSDKLSDIENLLRQTTKSSFSIDVTAVYWRPYLSPTVAAAGAAGVPANAAPAPSRSFQAAGVAIAGAQSAGAQRYDPIQEDEMAAFRQALVAASKDRPATPDGTGKSRSGLRSLTLFTGFEDTEMPESANAPALSTTQYGDLR